MSVQHDDPDFFACVVRELRWLLEYLNHPADGAEDGLERLEAKELVELGCEVALSIVAIGASMSEADLRAHRDVIFDALVRTDCGLLWTGREPPIAPSAGGAVAEATRLWARERRRDLDRKSQSDIREECCKVLGAHGTRDAGLEDVRKQFAEDESRKMRGVGAKKHRYRPAFLLAGSQLRALRVPPKLACTVLQEAPIAVGEGLTVTADPETKRIVVLRDGAPVASMSQVQFGKECMKLPHLSSAGEQGPNVSQIRFFFRLRSQTENASIDRPKERNYASARNLTKRSDNASRTPEHGKTGSTT